MRNALWIVVVIGCGGSSTPPPQQPIANSPPAPTTTAPAAPNGVPKEVCSQRKDDFGPVSLSADQVALRRGTGITKVGDIATSKAAPIEVCMPPGEREWLASVTCGDGSKPTFERSGSVGSGGTCGSILDLYMLSCPDKQYEVYMDMYMCPPGEGL